MTTCDACLGKKCTGRRKEGEQFDSCIARSLDLEYIKAQLKSCKVCGNELSVYGIAGTDGRQYDVECKTCDIHIGPCGMDDDRAIQRINKLMS